MVSSPTQSAPPQRGGPSQARPRTVAAEPPLRRRRRRRHRPMTTTLTRATPASPPFCPPVSAGLPHCGASALRTPARGGTHRYGSDLAHAQDLSTDICGIQHHRLARNSIRFCREGKILKLAPPRRRAPPLAPRGGYPRPCIARTGTCGHGHERTDSPATQFRLAQRKINARRRLSIRHPANRLSVTNTWTGQGACECGLW